MYATQVPSPFMVRDSTLISLENPQGHLITDSVYKDYQLEYLFLKEAGNCGVQQDIAVWGERLPKELYFDLSLKHQVMYFSSLKSTLYQ